MHTNKSCGVRTIANKTSKEGNFPSTAILPKRKYRWLKILLAAIMLMSASISLAQPDLYVENFGLTFIGDPDWTHVSMNLINHSNTPACCNIEIGIYIGKNTSLIPSQHLFTIDVGFFMLANDTLFVDTAFDFCDSVLLSFLSNAYRNGNALFIGYSVDPHDKIKETNETNNAGVFPTPLYLACTTNLNEVFVSSADNPFTSHQLIDRLLLIHTNRAFRAIRMYSMAGWQVELPFDSYSGMVQADLSSFPSGFYIIIPETDEPSYRPVIRLALP